jgi:perosamine synthetase
MKKELKVARPLFLEKEKVLGNIAKVLEYGRFRDGEFGAQFEGKFSQYLDVSHAVAVNSCTTAIEIVLRYIGVTGGEVIIPTNTCLATVNAALFAGGKPVLADIKPGTYLLDPHELQRRMSNKTKAVIVVYIAGYVPPEIEEIKQLCDAWGIPLVEDCAHALGASYGGTKAGAFGLAGCFSFSPTKIITTGTGGMIVTDDGNLNKYARIVRNHGAEIGAAEITHIGNSWFLNEISSCLGISQMESLDYFLERRYEIAQYYDRLVDSTNLLTKFPINELCKHVYYKYPLQISDGIDGVIDVQDMKATFEQKYGFELESLYWPPCHLQPIYRKTSRNLDGLFPVAESILAKQVALPLHVAITREDAEYSFNCLISEVGERMMVQ